MCLAEIFIAIAEHSICQPGRPSPHGDAPARLAGLGGLPQGEVERIVLAFVDRRRARPSADLEIALESLPYSANVEPRSTRRRRARMRALRAMSVSDIAMISGRCSDTRLDVGTAASQRVGVLAIRSTKRSASARGLFFVGERGVDDLVVDVR